MRSASQYSFARVPKCDIPRSKFDRSHTLKTAFDSGYLIPIYYDFDVLPGDTFNVNITAFSRLSTPVVPFMDNLYMDFFFFFVPYRLVWEHWANLCGERDTPVSDYNNDTVATVPQVVLYKAQGDDDEDEVFEVGGLADYFGLPTAIGGLSVSALPFRAYNLIWNEFFRDENLQDMAYFSKSDSDDEYSNYLLLKRGKRHDYFTSCLPWPQKGPGVELPLGSFAPVKGDGKALGLTDGTTDVGVWASPSVGLYNGTQLYGKDVGTSELAPTPLANSKALGVVSDASKSGLVADLSSATAATINSLREAFQIQKLYEKDARGGTRYVEILQSHFGVQSPDARLQRPEYLGGGQIPIQIHSVAQTSASNDVTPQGNLAATGIAGGRVGFSKSFVEHGMVIGLVSVRADLTYQQGLDRFWSRKDRFDFYWPTLAHLGEQAVLNKEIFCQGNIDDDKVFGYQERWAEYRYGVSRITGKLRSTAGESLDVWHLAQVFEELPTLSSDFIEDNPPVERVLAVTDEPQFIYDSLVNVNCVRPLPVYSVPGLVDHF